MALRKKIVKLAKVIGGLTGMLNKIDENAPEYYVLDAMVTDEMADVAIVAGLRKPRTLDYLVEKCGKSKEETLKLANQLADLGVFKLCTKNGVDTYMMEVFAPGMLEYMVNHKTLPEQYPVIGKAFEEYTRIRIEPLAPIMKTGKGLVRVVPIEAALEGIEGVKDYERISYYLELNDRFCVTDCTCRKTRRHMNEGCGHLEHDICMMLGETAEYYIRTGRGREITREEAYELMHKAEINGLVHEVPNIDGVENAPAICNCCSCSCFSMRVATMMNAPDVIRSNYVAEVKPENCVACGQCVEYCNSNALVLGQKLCDSLKPEEKETISPRDHMWNQDRWNHDYRINRENVAETGTAPCKTECPAHIAVQGYIKLASEGRYLDALELIKKENPLPAVCGRICPHKCEDACTRNKIDDPLAIDEIKKFIADQELNAETRFIPEKIQHYDKKIAVIGSGPAGLSCAYYLAVHGYKVTVFEKEAKLGGMLTLGIPAFRLEKNIIDAEIDVIRELGVEFKTGIEVGKDVTLKQLEAEGYEGFYIAIGAQGGRKLNIEGEDANNVISGVDFLKAVALDTPTKLNGNVVVIGGGNVAIDVARTAVRTGAETVNMYCLEARNEMPALDEEIAEAESEEIKINNSWGPKRIVVENGKVTGVEFKKCISVFDSNHKFSPKYDENNTIIVPADFVLLSIGQSIVWDNLLDGVDLERRPNGTVIADGFTFATNIKNIIAGGDCVTGPNFAINAIAAGKAGAESLHRSVWPGQSLIIGRDRRDYHSIDIDAVELNGGYDATPRQRPLHIEENEKTFKDTRATFTEEQLKKEANRCLGCGAVQINEEKCLGCGQCVVRCKFDAIHLKRKYNEDGCTFEQLPIKLAPYVVKRAMKIVARPVKDALSGKKEN